MRRIALFVLCALLAACGVKRAPDPYRISTELTVVDVVYDDAPMGCIGTNWNTLVQTSDGQRARFCGNWGKPGDKFQGCVVVSPESTRSSYRPTCD